MQSTTFLHALPRHPGIAPWALAILLSLTASRAGAQSISFDFEGALAGQHRLPSPWTLLGHPTADTPTFTVERDAQHGNVIRLHAKGRQADAIYRPAGVDLTKTPYINLCWRVVKHPTASVVSADNDEAIQVQLDFGRYGFKRRVLSYIYDSGAKPGVWYDDSSFFARNTSLVLDSGDARLNTWIAHSRNVTEDYRSQYGGTPRGAENISIFCDSNDSNSESLSYCAPITFTARPLHAEGIASAQ